MPNLISNKRAKLWPKKKKRKTGVARKTLVDFFRSEKPTTRTGPRPTPGLDVGLNLRDDYQDIIDDVWSRSEDDLDLSKHN